MRLWDRKDVLIIALAIKDVAPHDKKDAASLIVAAGLEAGIGPADLIAAINANEIVRWRCTTDASTIQKYTTS